MQDVSKLGTLKSPTLHVLNFTADFWIFSYPIMYNSNFSYILQGDMEFYKIYFKKSESWNSADMGVIFVSVYVVHI